MKCPKQCGARLKVTHTYRAGDAGTTRRLSCPRCGAVVTAVTIAVAVDPKYGQGASSLAQKMNQNPLKLPFSAPITVKK